MTLKVIHKDYDVIFTQFEYDEFIWVACVDYSKKGGDSAVLDIWHFLKTQHFKFLFGIRGITFKN